MLDSRESCVNLKSYRHCEGLPLGKSWQSILDSWIASGKALAMTREWRDSAFLRKQKVTKILSKNF